MSSQKCNSPKNVEPFMDPNGEARCESIEQENEYELYRVSVHTPERIYHFDKDEIIYCGENELIATVGATERWHIRNAPIIEKYRKVGKEEQKENSTENKLYYIENTTHEGERAISGYFSDIEKAKKELKECSDWYKPKGTGSIYSVRLNVLNDEPKLEYKM